MQVDGRPTVYAKVVDYDKESVLLRYSDGTLVRLFDSARLYNDHLANQMMRSRARSMGADYFPQISTPPWASVAEAIIKKKVLEDLVVDERPDILIKQQPDAEKFREIAGLLVRRKDGSIVEWAYKNQGSHLHTGRRITGYEIDIGKGQKYESGRPQKGDIVIKYHTHPLYELLSEGDISEGAQVARGIAKDHSLKDFYEVLYIPKQDKFYWFRYRKFFSSRVKQLGSKFPKFFTSTSSSNSQLQ